MIRPSRVPYGMRVVLVQDFLDERHSMVQAGDKLITDGDGEMGVQQVGPRRKRLPVPVGSQGTVAEGSYCGGLFDYAKECPVQFDDPPEGTPDTLGVPWELLEPVEAV